MNEISRSSIFRSKIKNEAKKREEKKPNKVAVIFKSPEEEKKFSEITHRLNYGKSSEDKIIER